MFADVSETTSVVDGQLRHALQLFGFEKFTPDQDKLIRASIAGRDVLGILPTNGGKSACYQVPGIETRSRTVVVSPLIALQDDQVQALRKLGIKAFALHSGLSEAKRAAVHFYFSTAARNEPSFLYLSPELLLTETFHQRFDGVGFDRLAVDEAHCVSTWGDAFRPDYQRVRVASQKLKIRICSAFSATVDPKIKRDIRKRIPLRPDHLVVEADPMRPNLELAVRTVPAENISNTEFGARRFRELSQLLCRDDRAGATIVYCSSRDLAFRTYMRMQKGSGIYVARKYGYSTYLFHAALPYEDKQHALTGFLNDERPIIFATSAFGMGINRPDVRQVVHYQVPQTLIDYAQQIGRAGRDGLPSLCTTLLREGDTFSRQLKKAAWDAPTYDVVESVHRNLASVLAKRTRQEGRAYNIQSFMRYMEIRVAASERIQFKETYLTRIRAAMAILQRVGIIKEDGDGLVVYKIMPGTKQHADLLELTHMHARMLVREQERLRVFFGESRPDQRRLWDILRTDEDLEPRKEEEVAEA